MTLKLKTWGLNIILMLVSLALFTLVLELSVRGLQLLNVLEVLDEESVTLSGAEVKKYNAKLVRSDNSLLSLEYDLNDPLINSRGMRDQEYQLESAENIRRIAVVGDSVTFGLGVPLEHTYVKQLQDLLNKDVGHGANFQVMNFGVSGYGTESELEWFKIAARPLKPELVIVGYIMNDPIPTSALFGAIAKVTRNAREFGKLAKKSQVFAWIKLKWDRALAAIEATNVYKPFYDPSGERWRSVVDSLRGFKRLSEEDDFQLIVVIFPMLYDFKDYPFARYHGQVLETLNKYDIMYLDLLPEYKRYPSQVFRIKDTDATHPNKLGHFIAAEKLRDLILNLK